MSTDTPAPTSAATLDLPSIADARSVADRALLAVKFSADDLRGDLDGDCSLAGLRIRYDEAAAAVNDLIQVTNMHRLAAKIQARISKAGPS